jgi:hypothetical protein
MGSNISAPGSVIVCMAYVLFTREEHLQTSRLWLSGFGFKHVAYAVRDRMPFEFLPLPYPC